MMRKNFVLFVLVPAILLCIVVAVFIHSWVESGLEYAGEAIVGARVEIDGLHVTLSPLGAEFRRLQVADPQDTWKNLFETGTVRFAMNTGQLLRAKYIIETIEVQGLVFGTRRDSDGALPANRRASIMERNRAAGFTGMAEQLLEKSVERTPVYDIALLSKGLNVDSLLRIFDFSTLSHIDTLRERASAAAQQWEAARADFQAASARLAQVEADLKGINPSALTTPDAVVAAIRTVDQSLTTVNDIKQSVSSRRDAVATDIQSIRNGVDRIDDLAKADLRSVLAMARLPQLKTGGVTEAILGPALMQDIARAMYWVDFARTNVARYTPAPEMEKPPRLEGQTIRFPAERLYPKLWIKTIQVSGGTDSTRVAEHLYLTGLIRNITSDQSATGEPMTVDLTGRRGKTQQAKFSALLDRRKEEAFDRYDAELRGIRLSDMAIGSPGFVPAVITGGGLAATLALRIPATRFDGTVGLQFRPIELQFNQKPRNTVERLTMEVLEGVRGFDASVRLWNTGGALEMALQTDLDDQLFERAKGVLGAELGRLTAEIRSRVDEKIDAKRREFEAFYSARRQEIEQQVTAYQSRLDSAVAQTEQKKKELEQRLEQVKKGAVDDALKKLLKR